MKIVYIAEIMWVSNVNGEKEVFNSIVDHIDPKDTEQIKKIAIHKFKKAIEYAKKEDNVVLLEEINPSIFIDGQKISYSHPIDVKKSGLTSSYMEVTFRPVIKAAGWFFELEPVPSDKMFVDSDFN